MMERFVVTPELQARLKRLSCRATIGVPEIQNFVTSAFTLSAPADQTGLSPDPSLLFSAAFGGAFTVFASHVDGTELQQLTYSG